MWRCTSFHKTKHTRPVWELQHPVLAAGAHDLLSGKAASRTGILASGQKKRIRVRAKRTVNAPMAAAIALQGPTRGASEAGFHENGDQNGDPPTPQVKAGERNPAGNVLRRRSGKKKRTCC